MTMWQFDDVFSRMSWVYTMASQPRGTLYVGFTTDMWRRVSKHRRGSGCAFTRKYAVGQLVGYQEYATATLPRSSWRLKSLGVALSFCK